MDKEIFVQSINDLLPLGGFFFLLVLTKNTFYVLSELKWKLKKFRRTNLWQILASMKTQLFGLAVMLCSFALTNTLLGGVPEITGNAALEAEAASNPSTILEGLLYISNTGIIGTSLFIIAGILYILSGFGAWIKWVARVFMLLAPAYILLQIFHYAILAA
jgi:hypothetical protein